MTYLNILLHFLQILPDFCGELTKQTAIFVPSYFDFVRVRNHMKRAELSHCLLSEYTKTSQVSRCRTEFYHKQKHFLLYTERLHFFRRCGYNEVLSLVKYNYCVEFDLHKVVITLSYFKVSYTIGFLVKKRFYLYAVELVSSNQLKVSIFHVEVPGIYTCL